MPYCSPNLAGFAFARAVGLLRAGASGQVGPDWDHRGDGVPRMTILRGLDWQLPGMPAVRRHRAAVMSRIEQSSGNMRFGFAASLAIWAVTLALLFG
jgi:hypothetical protein